MLAPAKVRARKGRSTSNAEAKVLRARPLLTSHACLGANRVQLATTMVSRSTSVPTATQTLSLLSRQVQAVARGPMQRLHAIHEVTRVREAAEAAVALGLGLNDRRLLLRKHRLLR